MSNPTANPKPTRAPWIIAGVLGCLVLCLLLVVIGGGAYYILSNNNTTTASNVLTRVATPPAAPSITVPTVVVPTVVLPSVVVPTLIVPTVVLPTVSQVQPTTASPVPLPTVALPTATATVSATATTAPTKLVAKPSGRLAFSKSEGDRPEDKYVWIMNADGTGAKKILDRASEPTFSPDGTKIAYYHWTDGIFVANADGTNPIKVVGDTQVGYIDWSHDGRWIAFSALPGGQGNIVINVVPPDGSAIKDSSQRRFISVGKSPAWSPDDTQLAIDTCDTANHCGIFKVSSAGGSIIPIVTDGGGAPVWAPDGKRILYQLDVDGQKQLFVINADGSEKKQLTAGPAMHVDAAWSLDGNFIFYRSTEGGSWGIWVMNADGTSPRKLIDNVVPVDFAFERLAITK